MLKRLTITGSTLRARNDDFKTAIANKLQQNVWPLLANGKIRPIINSTFNLEDANQAHALMESSQHIGKIILTV
jgi:NADPH2:quinone reductase